MRTSTTTTALWPDKKAERRAAYLGYLNEGFTKKQALKLVMKDMELEALAEREEERLNRIAPPLPPTPAPINPYIRPGGPYPYPNITPQWTCEGRHTT